MYGFLIEFERDIIDTDKKETVTFYRRLNAPNEAVASSLATKYIDGLGYRYKGIALVTSPFLEELY